MSSNEPRMVKPELSINKKLGNLKLEQVIDSATILQAEKVFTEVKPDFAEETLSDFDDLKVYFREIDKALFSPEAYAKISEISFSIKSRAATGGYPLASHVANSLYKFCDKAAEKGASSGHKVIELHIDALTQIFDNSFPVSDIEKSTKLVSGLEQIAKKFAN